VSSSVTRMDRVVRDATAIHDFVVLLAARVDQVLKLLHDYAVLQFEDAYVRLW